MAIVIKERADTGAPADKERVDERIAELAGSLAKRFPVRPLAVVLTGSFARAEGTVVPFGRGYRILGDVEFLVVFPAGSNIIHMQATLNRCSALLQEEWTSRNMQCELEFRAVTPEYFSSLRPNIFEYELLAHGKTVWGSPEILSVVPRFSACEIPPNDAWRLLNNRIIEQLEYLPSLSKAPRDAVEHIFYQLVKFQLDLGTAVLIFGRRYKSTYRARAQALARWAGETGNGSTGLVRDLSRRVTTCTEFKLASDHTRTALGACFAGGDAEELRRETLRTAEELAEFSHSIWRWAGLQLVGNEKERLQDDEILMGKILRGQSLAEKTRGWAKLALMPTVQGQPGFWRRMARSWHRGSPRYMVYRAASALYFSRPWSREAPAEQRLKIWERGLPVVFQQHAGEMRDWWRLRANILMSWRLFLRNHGA